jgi:hypothetical protein
MRTALYSATSVSSKLFHYYQNVNGRGHLGLNLGPLDLQLNVLTLSYTPLMLILIFNLIICKIIIDPSCSILSFDKFKQLSDFS